MSYRSVARHKCLVKKQLARHHSTNSDLVTPEASRQEHAGIEDEVADALETHPAKLHLTPCTECLPSSIAFDGAVRVRCVHLLRNGQTRRSLTQLPAQLAVCNNPLERAEKRDYHSN